MQLYVPPPIACKAEASTDDVLHWLQDMSFVWEAIGESESPPPPTADADNTLTPSSLCSSCTLSPLSSTGTLVESEASYGTQYPNIFVIGDAADAFDALKAGHTAYHQAEVAARNVLRLIHGKEKMGFATEEDLELEEYAPGPPAIKVSLGLTKSVYEVNGIIGTRNDGRDDLNAAEMWAAYGMRDLNEQDMFA